MILANIHRKDAKAQSKTRKEVQDVLCVSFAPLRLCGEGVRAPI